MCRVAWLICALLALANLAPPAHARIYERCELARELIALGVNPDHIATWVCIAFHESRFDTSANNPYSGDHGIFQISELYWCGPGKACGVSCAALRDDDISNDLECALQVHEEHTRLQGNGFLAWVVYPQHCKHNTKKYLVDCDTSVKSAVPFNKARTFAHNERYTPSVNYSVHNIEELLPSYLAIGNIFRGGYGKVLEHNKNRVDWYNYKVDNIDDLQLPQSFNALPQPVTEPSTTSTTTTTQTTTTAYIPPVKPWRTIETNQFRKKQLSLDKSTIKPATQKENTSVFSYERSTPSTTYQTTSTTTQRPYSVTTTQRPITAVTTQRPFTVTSTQRLSTAATTQRPFTFSTTQRPSTITTTQRPATITTTYKPRTTMTSTLSPKHTAIRFSSFTTSTIKSPIGSTLVTRPSTQRTSTVRPFTSVTVASTKINYTTVKLGPANSWFTPFTFTTRQPLNPSTFKLTTTVPTTEWPTISKTKTISWNSLTRLNATTVRPSTPRYTTTAKPFTTLPPTARPRPSTTTLRPYTSRNLQTSTTKPKDFSWYTFTSRTATTSAITKLQSAFQTTTPTPPSRTTPTSKPETTTQKPKTTQSIFDLYLNPSTKPTLRPYTFNPDSKFRLKIFDSGTTTPAPWTSTTTQKYYDQFGATKYRKREK